VNHRLRRQDLPCVSTTHSTSRFSCYFQGCGKSNSREHAS
jgi:hypothetical protein